MTCWGLGGRVKSRRARAERAVLHRPENHLHVGRNIIHLWRLRCLGVEPHSGPRGKGPICLRPRTLHAKWDQYGRGTVSMRKGRAKGKRSRISIPQQRRKGKGKKGKRTHFGQHLSSAKRPGAHARTGQPQAYKVQLEDFNTAGGKTVPLVWWSKGCRAEQP